MNRKIACALLVGLFSLAALLHFWSKSAPPRVLLPLISTHRFVCTRGPAENSYELRFTRAGIQNEPTQLVAPFSGTVRLLEPYFVGVLSEDGSVLARMGPFKSIAVRENQKVVQWERLGPTENSIRFSVHPGDPDPSLSIPFETEGCLYYKGYRECEVMDVADLPCGTEENPRVISGSLYTSPNARVNY